MNTATFKPILRLLALALALHVGSHSIAQEEKTPAKTEVMAAERAFAKTMADRNFEAFGKYVSDDAIFFGREMLRGKNQVIAGWRPFFKDKQAPFSWEPDQVEVLASGDLAVSTGLVKNPSGNNIGRFNSVWRLESPGVWKVVFDKGSPLNASDQ